MSQLGHGFAMVTASVVADSLVCRSEEAWVQPKLPTVVKNLVDKRVTTLAGARPVAQLPACAILTPSALALAAGSLHNAVVSHAGQVFTWGCNDEFALGRGRRAKPALVRTLTGSTLQMEMSGSLLRSLAV